MAWDLFDASKVPSAEKEIYVSLSPRSEFYLNYGAIWRLGEPAAVRLFFNRPSGLIGIAAAPLKAKAAIGLRLKYMDDLRSRTFRATAFCREMGLQFDRTIVFREAKFEDGMIVLDINKTTLAPKRSPSISSLSRIPAHSSTETRA